MYDLHCHIDLYDNPQAVLVECVEYNHTIISMTNLPSHFEMGIKYFLDKKRIRLALGMHPLMAEYHVREFPKFIENFSRTSYIGEIGLDFSLQGINTKHIQLNSLKKILSLVQSNNKILSLHSRKAEREVLSLLLEYNIPLAIFHWYSGSYTLVKDIVKAGYFFSVNQAMVKSNNGRKIIQQIPKELILTETDGPFIMNKNESLKPAQVLPVIKYLSELWNYSIIDVQNLIGYNFSKLIKAL